VGKHLSFGKWKENPIPRIDGRLRKTPRKILRRRDAHQNKWRRNRKLSIYLGFLSNHYRSLQIKSDHLHQLQSAFYNIIFSQCVKQVGSGLLILSP
jgi:hypothetical protein